MMKRRVFLKKSGLVAAGAAAAVAGLTGCGEKKKPAHKPVAANSKRYAWRMATTWAPDAPILQAGAVRFAERVSQVSGGRLTIQVFAGGELVPPLSVFDAVSDGTVECGSGAAHYWAGKVPAAHWFSGVPFGFNPQGFNAWLYGGGGLLLWEETYAPFNIVPRPQGNTGIQMGGWFRNKVSNIEDYKGLKMRIPGLGGKVVAGAGGTVVALPGRQVVSSLESGVLDATEGGGPLYDEDKGFYKAAKYYYYPGWHKPSTALEVMFNKKAYDALPTDLQMTLDTVAAEVNLWILCAFEAGNGAALQRLVSDHHVNLVQFPEDVLDALRKLAKETLEEEAAKSPHSRKVHEAFKKFKAQLGGWEAVSEFAYHSHVAGAYR